MVLITKNNQCPYFKLVKGHKILKYAKSYKGIAYKDNKLEIEYNVLHHPYCQPDKWSAPEYTVSLRKVDGIYTNWDNNLLLKIRFTDYLIFKKQLNILIKSVYK